MSSSSLPTLACAFCLYGVCRLYLPLFLSTARRSVGRGHHHATRARQYHSAERNRTQHVRIRRLDRVSCALVCQRLFPSPIYSSCSFWTLGAPRRRRSLLSQPTSALPRWSTIYLPTTRCSKSSMRSVTSSTEAISTLSSSSPWCFSVSRAAFNALFLCRS
jgi:hypothetical protein